METGLGPRKITHTPASPLAQSLLHLQDSPEGQENMFSTPRLKRPVLLLGDSMAQCIPSSDSVFMPVTRTSYTYAQMTDDINQGLVDIDYKQIVVWAGAHAIHHVKLAEIPAQLKLLINTIWLKNALAHIFVSSLLPKPRENHIAGDLIVAYNRGIKTALSVLKQQGGRVQYLPSHELVLDKDRKIVRPIIDNFEDGFHLNLHGAHRLRKFWMQQIGLNK